MPEIAETLSDAENQKLARGGKFSIEEFLQEEQKKDLLRFSTAGSVDDGKSTLIGRLLYDSHNVYEDHVRAVTRQQSDHASPSIDFAQLTDGLRAEREQGITIDVAYRYFSTSRRKFIIADTPGHEQYTRNMATGASTADVAIILIDARKGILPQSKRHAYIAALLGIPRVVAAINKMDLVDFSEEVFRQHEKDLTALSKNLGIPELLCIPVSALEGDNVVTKSARTPWYNGPSLLHHLETVPVANFSSDTGFRLPVQYVIRPHQDFRGFAGQIASGVVRVGDAIYLLPSGNQAKVKEIVTYDGKLEEATAPLSVTVVLDGEYDVSRGDVLVSSEAIPTVTRNFKASLVWMNAAQLDLEKTYLLKHAARTVKAKIQRVDHRVDINTFETISADTFQMNEIGTVWIETSQPLFIDPYKRNRSTGSFILIDPGHYATVAAGMIEEAADAKGSLAEASSQQRGVVVLLGAAWKKTLDSIEQRLLSAGANVVQTKVEDSLFWLRLLKVGAVVLVAAEGIDHVSLGALDTSQSKINWEHIPQGSEYANELIVSILEKAQREIQ